MNLEAWQQRQQSKLIVLRIVWYENAEELQLFCQQLQRFLNTTMTQVDVVSDDLPCN